MKSTPSLKRFDCAERYRNQFRKRVFRLVQEGYVRLRNRDKDYSGSIEEDISHDLCKEIENFLEYDKSRWVEKFNVQCERPISPHGEVGRSRPRLDIRIRSGERPFCPIFVFEAKRLRQGGNSNDYFGNGGVQRFWNGTGYPINVFREAGMLGYVQNMEPDHWANYLKEYLDNHKNDLHVCKRLGWDQAVQIKGIPYAFSTSHRPDPQSDAIVIFHLLLSFHQ